MLECELKLLDIDCSHVFKRLERLWATFLHEELIVDVYLRKELLSNQKAHARVRCTRDTTVLTIKYKLPTKWAKSAYEVDTPLPDSFRDIQQSRRKLVDHIRIKKRISYTRWGYVFDIDEYRGLPPLLEIEWPNPKLLNTLIKELWFHTYTRFLKGAKSLYEHYNVALPTVSRSFLTRLLSVIRCW